MPSSRRTSHVGLGSRRQTLVLIRSRSVRRRSLARQARHRNWRAGSPSAEALGATLASAVDLLLHSRQVHRLDQKGQHADNWPQSATLGVVASPQLLWCGELEDITKV